MDVLRKSIAVATTALVLAAFCSSLAGCCATDEVEHGQPRWRDYQRANGLKPYVFVMTLDYYRAESWVTAEMWGLVEDAVLEPWKGQVGRIHALKFLGGPEQPLVLFVDDRNCHPSVDLAEWRSALRSFYVVCESYEAAKAKTIELGADGPGVFVGLELGVDRVSMSVSFPKELRPTDPGHRRDVARSFGPRISFSFDVYERRIDTPHRYALALTSTMMS